MDILHGLITGNEWVWAGLISVFVLVAAVLVMLVIVLIELHRDCDLRAFEGKDYEINGKACDHGSGDSGDTVGDSENRNHEPNRSLEAEIPAQARTVRRARSEKERHSQAVL